jgi:hypothetical protein
MPGERGLRNNGTQPARFCKPDCNDDHMNKKDQDFAHRGMLSKPLELLNHRGFSNSPPTGTVHRSRRLGGTLNYYYRVAA